MGDGTECPVVNAYGKGMNASVDCELGLALNHSGGYPGYGTYVLLLPEHDVGLFAFSNRTYDAPRGPIWDEIGRASCRERVCQDGSISVVAVSFKKNTKKKK